MSLISIFNSEERELGEDAQKSEVFFKVSVKIREGLLAELKGAPLAVFFALGSHLDEKFRARPSIETLCKETGYGTDTVIAALNKLCSITWQGGRLLMAYQERKEGGVFAQNEYIFLPRKAELEKYAALERAPRQPLTAAAAESVFSQHGQAEHGQPESKKKQPQEEPVKNQNQSAKAEALPAFPDAVKVKGFTEQPAEHTKVFEVTRTPDMSPAEYALLQLRLMAEGDTVLTPKGRKQTDIGVLMELINELYGRKQDDPITGGLVQALRGRFNGDFERCVAFICNHSGAYVTGNPVKYLLGCFKPGNSASANPAARPVAATQPVAAHNGPERPAPVDYAPAEKEYTPLAKTVYSAARQEQIKAARPAYTPPPPILSEARKAALAREKEGGGPPIQNK